MTTGSHVYKSQMDLGPGLEWDVWVELPKYTDCGKVWWYQIDATIGITKRAIETAPHNAANLLKSVRPLVTNNACPAPAPPPPPDTPPGYVCPKEEPMPDWCKPPKGTEQP